MLRDSRRRSPESSRRRRAERRHSREQLAATAGPSSAYIPGPQAPQYTTMIPQHQPSNVSLRSRADSSTSNTSSTSSSLLNISRKPRGFGIRSFFTSSAKSHSSKKKKRRAFRSKNSSSSSVDSDLAYGRGYIPKSTVNSPRHAPAHPSYRDTSAPVLGPDGRPALRRAQTDEEILELGRKLSLYARAENDKDLIRAGRSRPSQVAAGVAAISRLSRHDTSDSQGARGIGSSKPGRRHDSDDSDWESASDDDGSSSDDYDAGLAYGSAQFSSTYLPQTRLPTHTAAPTIISQPPPEDIRPPNRKASAVDPAMFGPVNSLRGYINTPCGFRPGEYQRPQALRYDPHAPVPQPSSASIEANRSSQQPMRMVYPVPTSDPGRVETTGSVISGYTQHPHESPINVSRPAPVPIQAPKPIVPVSTRVLEARRIEEDRYREREREERRKAERQHDGPGLAGAAVAGVAAAAIGGAVLSSSRDKRDREKEARRAEEDRDAARQREKEARRLDEERELARKREKEARRVVEEREKEARRLSEERTLADREFEKRRQRDNKDEARRDDRKVDEKEKDKKRRDSTKSNVLVVDERVAEAKRKEERRKERREKQRKELEEIQAEIERQKALLAKEGKEIPILAPSEPPPSRKSRRKETREVERSTAPVDPFQFQVEDDAFPTPQFTTPARPLTPAVMTIEREPKWDDDLGPDERMSRKDSYEQEQTHIRAVEHAQIQAVVDETEHSTIPAHPEVIAAVIASENNKERRRTREAEPTRDPIEEANRWYRNKREIEREEESRSRSPEPSVVEKYKDEGDDPVVRIITPPAMEHPPEKSKYDGPNADVRIDHVITPRELHMFRVPPTSLDPNRGSPPKWKSRDPSCERERPLLNLVRPTPEPSPMPEKQEQRGRVASRSEPTEDKPHRSERSRSRSRSRSPSPSIVLGPRGEVRQAPPDTPTSKSVTWGENDTKHYNPSSPDRTSEEREAAEKLRSVLGNKKKTGGGWGDLAAAFAAAAASGTLPGMSSNSTAREQTEKETKSVAEKERSPPSVRRVEPERPSIVTSSPPSSRSIVDDHEQPPQPGPKPPSPSHHTSQKQMPGAFADDLDFTAHLAAGLQSSGFDPNIVIDDATYRRRDSPPGSNVSNGSSKTQERHVSPPSSNKLPYQRPFAETVTDLGIIDEPVAHTKPRDRGFAPDDAPTSQKEAPAEDEWEPTIKSKKNGKKSKRNTIDLVDPAPTVEDEAAPEQPDFEPKLSKKEQKKRDKAARLRDFDDESSTAREPDLVVAEPREAEWAPKLSKKEQKKRDRAARDEGSSTPRETEAESVVDDWKEEKGKKGKKRDRTNRKEDGEEESFTPRALEREAVMDAPEDDWADAKASKKDKKKRDKAAREEAPSTPREVEYEQAVPEPGEEEWAEAKSNKKDKKKRDKADRGEESFTSGVLVSEPASVGNDEWEEPKSSKKDKKGKKNRKSGSAWDDVEEATPSDDRSVSVPVDAFSDLQRTAVPAQDDEWDTPSKKSKKKSKRDSTYDTYDSPSRSVAPSEISVESSSKKDKKSKRDSAYDTYDSPSRSVAPSEVSVESSSKKDKKSRRKSTKDSYDRPDEGEPPDKRRDSFKPIDRDVSSLVSEPTRYDDRRESRFNGSWADEVEEAQSVVSAPPSSDRKDRKKRSSKDSKDEKSSKEEKRSSGGFFGLFKGTNGGGSETQKDSDDKQSFLGNAGILGAGAGLAGAALASALVGSGAGEEEDARPKATKGTSGKEGHTSPTTSAVEPERSVTPPGRTRSISLGSQHVDPEIIQRAIKPAIDPQYGDLLPLPPSVPGSPNRDLDMEIENELPALPESRPDTPPAQQQQERSSLSTTKTHVRRRSAFETPTKSPSQTAIPIHFRLGQRSVPPSPGMARSSPIQSPSFPTPEIGSVPKSRSRPNSWGRQMLGEPKPLYLVEKASSGSMSTDYEDQQYPALPPSEPASSRESPAPESERREGDVDYSSLAPHTEMSDHELGHALRLDTALAALDRSEPLGSAELTPKAERAPEVAGLPLESRRESVDGSQSMDDSFHSATQSPVYRRDSSGLATEDVELPGEFLTAPGVQEHLPNVEERSLGMHTSGRTSPTVRGHHDHLDDLTELPPLPASSGTSLVDEPLPSRDLEFLELAPEEVRPAEDEPAAVEPMTKDRSSYLLHQTPPSAKTLTGAGVRDRTLSPSPSRKHEKKSGSDLDIAAGVAAGLFGSGVVAALMHEDRSSADHALASGKSEAADDRLNTVAEDKAVSASKPDSPSGSIKSAEDLLTPDEFSFIPTKKGKKGKKGRKGQTVESTAESEPSLEREVPAEHQSVREETLTSEKKPTDEAAPVEETMETPGQEEFSTPLPIPSSLPTTQDQDDGFFESASSKKSKKKQKKALGRNILMDDAPVMEESAVVKEDPEVTPAPLERSVSVSSKKGKKKKGKQAFVWEPEDATDDSTLTPAEDGYVVAAKDVEPTEVPIPDNEIGVASQILLPASPESSRPTSPALVDEPVEAPPAPLERSTSKKGKKKKGKQGISWEPDEATADIAPFDDRAQNTAQETEVQAPDSGEHSSLSQEQTLVAEPASQSRDLEPTLTEADARAEHKPEPEADAEPEWALRPGKKGKKSKKDKKGKKTQSWELDEPSNDAPGAFPETPALEVQEPEGFADATLAEESLPGTFPETPAVEVQEPEAPAKDSLSGDPLPGGFPVTPAIEGTEPLLPAPDVPAIPSQEETLVDEEGPVLPEADTSNAEPELEAETWQPTPKKGKKGKKGKKQTLMWETEEPPKDGAPSLSLIEPQTHIDKPADSSTEVKDRELHTGDLPTGFINEDVPADIAQAAATPEAEESSTPTTTKKGKKDKKAKKRQFVWEPEESAAEEPLTASTTLEQPSASEMPPVILPPSLSSQPTIPEENVLTEQPAPPEEHTVPELPTVSERATLSKESAPADTLPVLEEYIRPATPAKIFEQSIMPSTPPKVTERSLRPVTPPKISELTMASQADHLDDAINTPLPDEGIEDEILDSEHNGMASAPPATSDRQPSPSNQPEEEVQSTATRSPTADPAGEHPANKGLVTSALSMLPSVAAVGSLFGLGKGKEKEHEADTKSGDHTSHQDNDTLAEKESAAALNTPDETRSVDAVELPLGEASDEQGPDVGGPTADMQSITPASESAQATHEVADTATVLIPDQQASPQEYDPKSTDVHGTRSIEEPLPEDNQSEGLHAPSSQDTLLHEATPLITDDQHPNIDESQPYDTMDWELKTVSGKKKGKKDKKGRAKAQSDTPFEVTEPPSTSQVPSTETRSQHADRELQSTGDDDLLGKAVDDPSVIKDSPVTEAPVEATPDDEWALTSKKGKKDKKKRQKPLPVFENPDLETGGESSVPLPEESQVTDIPNITPEDTTSFGEASEPAKDIAGTDAPVEPSAEDLWAEPIGKKGKKGKKNRQKTQSTFDVLDPEPSGASTPLEPTEGIQTPVVPAESEEQSESPRAEASKELSAGAPEEPTPEDFWAETSGKKGKKDKKNKKQTARDLNFEPPPAAEETRDVEPVAEASKPEAQEPSQPTEGTVATGQDNLETTADDLWGFATGKKGKKGKKDKKKGSSKTSSGIATPTVEEAPVVEETATTDRSPAPVGTVALDEPPVTESIPAVGLTTAEEPVAARETVAAETRLVQESQTTEGSPDVYHRDVSDEHLAEQTPAFEELPASGTTDTVADTPAHDKVLTAEETSVMEETPNTEQHPAFVPQEQSTLEHSPVLEPPGAIEQPIVLDVQPAGTEASILEETSKRQLPEDAAQPAITPERSLTEGINVTPVTLDEIHSQQTVEPSSDDIWEESTKRGKKDKKGKKKKEPTKDSDAEIPLTESATVSEPTGAAEQLTEALPEASQTEAAAAIDRLTGDLREGGETEDPDIGIEGVGQQKAEEEERVVPPAEGLWEQPTSGKKGKKGKKNKQASKSFDFELPDTAESSQGEVPRVTYDNTSLDKLDEEPVEPVEAAAEDIWENNSGKKGKKNKKKGKLSRQNTFEEPSQPETTEHIDETQTPDTLQENQEELQKTLVPSESEVVASEKEAQEDDPWAEASTKKSKKGKKGKNKSLSFSWDDPSLGQTEEPQVLDTATVTPREAAPDVGDEEPAVTLSTSPLQLPSDALADRSLASIPPATEETSTSMPQADADQGVEDSFWPTTKKKGKGKKRSKMLDLSQPELAPEDSQDSETPTPGDTSVVPSADESGPSIKGKKGKDKRRVSWALPAEEVHGGTTDTDSASREATEAPVPPVVSDESQAASSVPAAHPASGEELEMSKELPHLEQQDHSHKSPEPSAAGEVGDAPVHGSAPPPDHTENQPSGTHNIANMHVLLSEPAASTTITQLDQPSVPAAEAISHETGEDQHTPETVTDISTIPIVSESKDMGAEQYPRDELSQVPQPFEEDLSALLPTSPYSVSLRKSKKDKKKRQSSFTGSSGTTSPTENDQGQASMPDPTAVQPAMAAPEAAPKEPLSSNPTSDPDPASRELKPIEDELELPQSFTLKRSKKDKKKGKAKSMPWDDVESSSDNSPSESWSTPPVPATQLSTIMEGSTEDLPGSVVEAKRLQDVIVAEEQQPEDRIDGQQVAESTPDSQTADAPRDFESDASQRNEEAATTTAQDAPPPVETAAEVEDLSWSTKKDKKGKKGKKSQSAQPEPTPVEEPEPPTQEDTTLRSAEDPHEAESKQDAVVTPSSGKKGKKAKKNKGSAFALDELEPTPEAEPPREVPLAEKELPSEDVGHAPLKDTQPEAVEDLPTEPQPAEPEHVRSISTSDAQEVPEAKVNEAEPIDLPEGKPQDVTEQATEPEPASLQEPAEAEDEWATPVKKSKKGKKGKSARSTESNTPSGTSTPLIEDAPVEVSEPSSTRDIGTVPTSDDIKEPDAPQEPAWTEAPQQEVQGEDIWASASSKKSKKDKKKKGSKAFDSEPPSGTQTPAQEKPDLLADRPIVEAQEPAEAIIVSEEPATITEAQEAHSEDIWDSPSTKKSKKDKKRKGSKLTEVETPSEPSAPTLDEQPVSHEVEDLPLAETAEPVDDDIQPSSAVEPEPEVTAEPEPEDLWVVSGKKSKKDKKRKGSKIDDAASASGTATPSAQEDSSARELDTSAGPDIEPGTNVDAQQEADIEADDSWATSTKKSKKDKKGKGKQAAAGLLVGAAALSAVPVVSDFLAGQKDKEEAEPSRELPEAVETEVEPDNFWETPAKNSKKDKKGKKNSSRSNSGTATPAREDEVVLPSDRTVDDAEVKETPEAKETPIDTPAEQDDFPEFSTKKSKKDKKKKKGKQLALAESGATSETQEDFSTEAHVRTMANPDLPEDVNYSKTPSEEPPSSKVEINPAVLGALRLSPDHGLKALLPSVETSGFIEPHVLYPIDTASPKLLTGSPPPKELLGAPPEATREVDLTPSQESSRVSHSPPFDNATQRKRAKTLEVDQNSAGETINPAREIAASYLEEKGQDPTEDEHRDDIKLSGQEPSPSVPFETSSTEESRDIAASYLEDKSTEAPREMPLSEEPEVIDTKPEPSARDIAAAVLEVGPKTLLNTEDKSAVEDSKVPTSKDQDLPSPEARRLAASWLEHEHEQHHHESPAREDEARTGPGINEREITNDEPMKSASSLTSSSEDVRQGKSTPSNKKTKRRSTQDDSANSEAAAAAGALAGGVTLLAEKFGGSKKKKGKQKKQLDKRTPRDDDLFDDPALWEGADRRPLEGSRMDENADGFWDVPDVADEVEQRDMDVDEKAETKDKDVMMGDTDEQGPLRLREVMEEAAGDYIESPTLGRRASERKRDAERRSKAREEDDTTEIQPVQRAFSFPDDIGHEDVSTPVTAAPVLQREMVEDTIDDYSPVSRSVHHMSSIPDFRRSVPSLPPVQEEAAEEAEPEKHHTRHLTRTPEVNRDSGFLSDSPASQRRSHRFDDDGHRDSGVHLRDWPEGTPPRPSESRFEAHPARTSGSSLKAQTRAYDEHGTPDRQRPFNKSPEPSRLTPSRALGQTPKLREPSPPPRTPEPQKTLAKKRTTRQLDNEPTPERNVGAVLTPVVTERRVVSDNSALRQYSKSPAETSAMVARRSASNTSISRHRTPEPLNLRPDTPGSIRSLHSGTPPLRRVDKRVSGDLRSVSLSQRSVSELSAAAANKTDSDKQQNKDAATAAAALGVAAGAAALALAATNSRASQNTTPVANEGRVRTKDMADVYDGFGEGRIGSPRSPTRPHSMRRRQSMQVLDLENKVKELEAENIELSRARSQVEQTATQRASMALAQRDAEIDTLKQNIAFLQKEVDRLAEVNEGLSSANAQIAVTHTDRYRSLESQHAEAARELERTRGAHNTQLQQKDAEIAALRAQLEEAKDQIRHMQEQILASSPSDAPDFLRVRDVDYFDHRCQQLCSHVQQWVLRFSKFSDMRACRLTSEINDEKIIDRLDNAVLDGSDVDTYLTDRVRRRDIFMSMTMTMVWEFVFTRYLFGMDREQRQKLKSLEKILLEVGPPHAVRQWRAITLTLLASRPQFKTQRDADTEAVVQAVFQTLSVILPPPTNMEDQIQNQLRKVMREAVDLAVEMRTQRAEYMMLPPLQPEYDDTGELTETVSFNASLMNERSGESTNEEWEAAGSVVRVVLFPLVVKKGDDEGKGDDEVVVSPAQVLVAKPSSGKRSIRMVTPSSDAGGASLFARSVAGNSPAGTVLGHGRNGSNVSMGGTEGGEGEFI